MNIKDFASVAKNNCYARNLYSFTLLFYVLGHEVFEELSSNGIQRGNKYRTTFPVG
jgi:hypothetical protein